MGIELYLQGPTIRVHGMDYLIGQLHEELDGVIHCQNALSSRIVSGARGAPR